MNNELGFKELYDISLKATYPIEVGGEIIEAGETIAFFDRIQIANFQEVKNQASANGGFDNRAHIYWESTKEIRINFTQGIFSKTQLALMTNAKLIDNLGNEEILVNSRETHESDELGIINLKHIPRGRIFIYDASTGKKIKNWSQNQDVVTLTEAYKNVVVDYSYAYTNGNTILRVGKPLTTGFFSLVGKMRVKDGDTGKVATGIIKIPKLRLMSDLSMRVGSDAIPQVGRLDAVAVPEGGRGQTKVMEIIFLNDDIDADM